MGIVLNKSMESRIDGVVVEPLKQIEDERGAVLHMMRANSSLFSEFGEIYFSIVNPNAVKAWKCHKKMTQHFTVPIGRIKLILFDDRSGVTGSAVVEEIILGRPDLYYMVRIPPLIWYGFQGISEMPSLLANCSDMPHDQNESEQLPVSNNHIHYNWRQE